MTKKDRKPILPLILGFSILGVVVLTAASIWLIRGVDRPRAPVYEEVYSGSPELAGIIKKIDSSVYESLYRSGISEKDIFFLAVEPKTEGGYHWEFTKLLVKCRDEAGAHHLESRMLGVLSGLGSEVSVRKTKPTEHSFRYAILSKGFHTHTVILDFGRAALAFQKGQPKIALIIDDLGYDPELADAFMHLRIPVTLSVLPLAPFTRRIVDEARKRGCELMVHVPMEPKSYPRIKPGPGALFVTMDDKEIRQKLIRDLNQVPGAKGVNNHMGSLFTEDRDKMMVVMEALRKRHLFFIDSRTTADSVGYNMARSMGVPAAERTVFLDDDLHLDTMEIQVKRLLNVARHEGWAIGIGHPHKETLKLLKDYLGKVDDGVEVVPASKIVG